MSEAKEYVDEVLDTSNEQFDFSALKPQEHEFIQFGNYIKCTKDGHLHGSRIPKNKILTKEEGAYGLVELEISSV